MPDVPASPDRLIQAVRRRLRSLRAQLHDLDTRLYALPDEEDHVDDLAVALLVLANLDDIATDLTGRFPPPTF